MTPTANGLEPSVAVDKESLRQEPTGAIDVGDADVDRTGASGGRRGRPWKRILAHGVLLGLALILALGAGYLKWQVDSAHQSQTARVESVQAATDSTVALLSYHPQTIDKDLAAARDRLTGDFRDSYNPAHQRGRDSRRQAEEHLGGG
jgi:Mce-associated membrane protein